ncbi:ABC transporter permease [Capnocytophaga felis]|uniref:Membrane protein n=1 Tax=Capnocytophaga felis TaxID=2267611 RepID=A0A5M4B7A2_9FLAO|nr:FtsX-like permease family protein [Capnocytophaga felis]GET45471.1 membrane protein [Capnocytophaga felis]GET47366.1 membrane protein [Capnocytophaga felis]
MIAKSSQNVINIINRITALVVVIGGAALFIVLAGFAGLKTFTLSFSSFFDPDLKIFPKTGKTISISEREITKLRNTKEIVGFSQIIEEQVFLNHKEKNHIAYIKGVDENYSSVNKVDSILVLGSWDVSPPSVVVGATIFNHLGLAFFDGSSPMQIVVPKAGKGSIMQETKPYREAFVIISGIYQITEELDKKYVFSSLSQARDILGLQPNEISAIEVKLSPNIPEKQAIEAISRIFGDSVIVKNRAQLNNALYRMLNTENIAIYLIFTLVLIIALFNLVGAIIMMILDKKNDLRTLYALGMTEKQMQQIFFLQGTMVSVIGAFVGVALGIIIVLLQKHFQWIMISSSLPYPVEIEWTNIFIVFGTIVILGILASFLASSRVKISDSKAL